MAPIDISRLKPSFPKGIEIRLAEYLNDPNHSDRRYLAGGGPDLPDADPDNGFNYLHLANSYLCAYDFPSALRVYEALDSLEYGFMGYYDCAPFHIGWAEADRGNFDTALASFERACVQYPQASHELSWYIGTVHHQVGRYEQAASCYQDYLSHVSNKQIVVAQLERAKNRLSFDGCRSWPI